MQLRRTCLVLKPLNIVRKIVVFLDKDRFPNINGQQYFLRVCQGIVDCRTEKSVKV